MLENSKECGGVRNSAVASQPCPSGHITADMRLQPSAFAQILASLGLLISAKRYVQVYKTTKRTLTDTSTNNK